MASIFLVVPFKSGNIESGYKCVVVPAARKCHICNLITYKRNYSYYHNMIMLISALKIHKQER